MRHRWLSFWLVLCLLLTQAAGAHHVVSHLAAELASTSTHDQDEDPLCAQCLAYAAVDVALPVVYLPPVLTVREWHFPVAPLVRWRSADAPLPRNRDPPPPVSRLI